MKLTARNIGVDAGLIMISDYTFYQQYGYRDNCLGFQNDYFELERGLYNIKYKVLYTWKDKDPSGEFKLNLISGKLVVSDPCYIAENWDKFIYDMENKLKFRNSELIDIGGDGMFKAILDVKKVKQSERDKKC